MFLSWDADFCIAEPLHAKHMFYFFGFVLFLHVSLFMVNF